MKKRGKEERTLEGKSEGVDIGDVVGNDREGEDDEQEASEATHGTDEGSAEKTTESSLLVSLTPRGLVNESGHHESSEALDEDDYAEERGDERAEEDGRGQKWSENDERRRRTHEGS